MDNSSHNTETSADDAAVCAAEALKVEAQHERNALVPPWYGGKRLDWGAMDLSELGLLADHGSTQTIRDIAQSWQHRATGPHEPQGTSLDSAITKALAGMGYNYRDVKEHARLLDELIEHGIRHKVTDTMALYKSAREAMFLQMAALRGETPVYVDIDAAEQMLQYGGYAGTVESTRAPDHWVRAGFKPSTGATIIINVQHQTLCMVDEDGEYAYTHELGYTSNAIRRLCQNWLDTQ